MDRVFIVEPACQVMQQNQKALSERSVAIGALMWGGTAVLAYGRDP